jgi:hypothetical protein
MKTNQEILDEFGYKLIEEVYDFNFILLKKTINHVLRNNEISKKNDLICSETLQSVLFNFLKIFEENEQFKIYYEANGQKVNLVEISEMLKAEPIIENGWIERFSNKELNNERQ